MTHTNSSTSSHKGKHLTYEERCQISILVHENYSNRHIAKSIERAPQTINNEIKRGTIRQIRRQKQGGKVYTYTYQVYDPKLAQSRYEDLRKNSGRRPKWVDSTDFIDWADQKMLEDGWSPDTVVGFANRYNLFANELIPCTTTLYHWIDSGIMRTKNIDLLEKLSRKIKNPSQKVRRNKRVLGTSIEERPQSIDTRETFGHWEIDTVIGNKTKSEPVLLTLVERQTRFEVILKIDGKDAESVDKAVTNLKERAGDQFEYIFKSITSDNGSEFSGLHEGLSEVLDVYFTHPYASWERGTSENQHKFIRRFIPKGNSMSDLTQRDCLRIQQWMNDYPRKILGYQTPHEVFTKAFKKVRQEEGLVSA